MSVPYPLTSFAAGEIAPALYGHVDLAKFNVAANTLRNMYVGYRGGVYSRAGTKFCARSKQPTTAAPPRVIKFQFSITQGYALEFGDNYMRVFSNGSPVVETSIAVTAAARTDPAQVTIPGNGYAAGDWITFNNIQGMTQLNGNTYVVASAGSTVTLNTLNGAPVDATGFGAFVSGGGAARTFTLATPYAAVDLPLLKFTQSADVMSLVHPNYPPYDLARITAIDWTLTEVNFGASIAAPASCSVSATTQPSSTYSPPTLPAAYAYCITAVDINGEESVASPIGNVTNGVDIAATSGSNVVTGAAVAGAASYNVYKAPTSYNTDPGNTSVALPVPAGASFGYCATIFGTQFVDSNVTADMTQVPPLHTDPFAPGQVESIAIVAPGSGYSSASVSITSAHGSGFIGQPVIVSGQVVSIIVQNAGQNYAPGDAVVIGGGSAYASGSITFASNPTAGSTITLNGAVWTFVASMATGNETNIGASLASTLASLAVDLNASSSTAIDVAAYAGSATDLTITYKTPGAGGDAYTLAASAATVSGATLTGGGSLGGATATATIGPTTGTYPGCVAYFQQRRVYAATLANPDTYWMSKPGAFLNFDSSIPVTDGDAISGTPWSEEVNGIQALVAMPGGLVVLTGLGAWQVAGAGSSSGSPQAITPSNQQAQPQAFNGCSAIVPPIKINFDILYVQAKGSIVRDLNYNFFLNVYTGVDLTQISGHLFTGYTIREWAWCEEPYKVAWVVRSDFTLLSLTYLKEQEVYGWARHDTLGQFYSVCSVVEPPTDALYLAVCRFPPSGPGVYFIERMDDRIWPTVEDCWCVDAGLRYATPEPGANLSVFGISGSLGVSASAAVFSMSNIGQVIRAAGGIGVITGYVSSTQVVVNFIKPVTQGLADNPQAPVAVALAGSWTMTEPTETITGLQHLAGFTVAGLADGIAIPPVIVPASGTITLPFFATAVTIGLPFQAQFQSTYANPATQPTVQGRRKDIVAATARLEASAGIKAGTNQVDGSTMFPPANAPIWSGMVSVPDQGATYTAPGGATVRQLFTGDERVNLFASYRKPGQVALQQDNPLPMNIIGIFPEALDGDSPEQTYSPKQGQDRDPRQGARGPGAWMLAR